MFDKTALLKSEHPQPESKVLTARVYPEYSTTLEIPGKYIHTVQTLKLLERAALGRSGKPLVFALFNNVFSLSLSLLAPSPPPHFLAEFSVGMRSSSVRSPSFKSKNFQLPNYGRRANRVAAFPQAMNGIEREREIV